MSQKARPIADVSVSGWSPQPVYAQINELVPNDNTYVTCAGTPGGDTFVVELPPLDIPRPGTQQLSIRLRSTSPDGLPVTVSLLSDNNSVATRVLTPSNPGFSQQDIILTASEINNIKDYTKLTVLVSTAPPPILRRSLGGVGQNQGSTTQTLSNVQVNAGEMLIACVGSEDVAVSSVTYNGVALNEAVSAINNGKCRGGIYYLVVNANTTANLVVTWSSSVGQSCLNAVAVSYLNANQFDQHSANTGTGSDYDSGSTPTTTAAKEYVQGLIVVTQDSLGVWINGFTDGLTTLSGLDWPNPALTIDEGYRIVSATGSYDCAMNTDVTGRFKTGHLWALQNRPGYKGILHPIIPIVAARWARSSAW